MGMYISMLQQYNDIILIIKNKHNLLLCTGDR